MRRTVTRFAPSPTGLLHLGHAHSALFAAKAASDADGRFLLRIEDIDAGRCRPEFEQAIYDDLAWLGLGWDEPVRRQSEHMADYAAALGRLAAMGTFLMCLALTSSTSQAPSNRLYTGFQYTPVDSIATCVTWCETSQSLRANRSRVSV